MFRSLRIGSLAGIDVFVHWTFLLLLGFFLLSGLAAGQGLAASLLGVGFVMALFGCVVLHELGHALAARRYGIPTRDITLLPIGGVARLERIPERPSEELVVALAGPAVNVLIAGVLAAVLWPLNGWSGLVDGTSVLHGLMRVNLLLVAFNLLPAFPMDGGRVLRALLASRMDYVRATDAAARVGQIMAVVFALAGLFIIQNPFLLLVGLFVFFGAGAESRMVRMRRTGSSAEGFGQGRPMSADPMSAGPVGDRVGDFMRHRYRVLSADEPMDAVAGELLQTSQRSFPVVRDGRLIGMLRRADVAAASPSRGGLRAGDVMRRDVLTAEAEDKLTAALARLLQSDQDTLAVLHEGRLVGLLQVRDAVSGETSPRGTGPLDVAARAASGAMPVG